MDIQEIVKKNIQKALVNMGIEKEDIFVEMPNDTSHGDYATNIAMQLSKELKKSPREIAEDIVKNIEHTAEIEKVEVAGPGFINFYISDKYLVNVLKEVKEKGDEYGKNNSLSGKKIMVEYTDANPFKVLHIGHLYSNTVGESLSRLLEASGADIKRACYQGDVGLHVAKTLWGLEKVLKKQSMKFEDMYDKKLVEKVKILGDAYMYGYDFYDTQKNPKAVEEIEKINRYIFSLFIKMPEEDFSELENSNLKTIYEMTREWSLDYFDLIYKRVGTKFDRLYFESEVGEKGLAIVEKNMGEVFKKDDGAVIYKGDPKKGLHTRVFVNKQGVPTYEAKEMGLALLKHEEFELDESIMVTANEQDGYFKVVLDAFSKIYPDIARELIHISHGTV